MIMWERETDWVREQRIKKGKKKEWIGCMVSYKIDDIVVMF